MFCFNYRSLACKCYVDVCPDGPAIFCSPRIQISISQLLWEGEGKSSRKAHLKFDFIRMVPYDLLMTLIRQ